MGCLSEQVASGYVERSISLAERAAVLAHIDACEECRTLVSEVVRSLEGSRPATAIGRGGAAGGATIGRYRIEDVVGCGAMGVVYAARDPELGRTVAVKVMAAESAGLGGGRLQREAQAMARLSHPNVVRVYDVGTCDGRVFVAMELVEGRTLAAWLREEPRARRWEEVIATFVLAGRGLAAAHDKALVHRDFKPDNVLVGHDGRVLVTDFGLARGARPLPSSGSTGPSPSAGPDATDATDATDAAPRLTRSGVLAGTPFYMAPEQFRGEPVDPRTDQFSFCVALYEALFGERPFSGASLAELAANVGTGLTATAHRRTPVPQAVTDAVLRGLAPDPSARHSSMSALLAILEAAPPPHRRTARRRLGMAAAAVAALAALGGAALGIGGAPWARPVDAPEREATALAKAGRIDDAVAGLDRAAAGLRGTGDRRRLLAITAHGSKLLTSQGAYTAAIPRERETMRLARELHDDKRLAESLVRLATDFRELGRFDDAKPVIVEATTLLRDTGDRAELARFSAASAIVHLERVELDAARELFASVRTNAHELGDVRAEGYAIAGLASVHEAADDLAGARALDEQWLMLSLRSDLGNLAKLSLAILAIEDGRLADAEALARTTAQDFVASGHPQAPALRACADATLAWALLEQGRIAEASEAIDRARADNRRHEVQRIRLHVTTIAAVVDGFSGSPAKISAAFAQLDAIDREAGETGALRAGFWARYARGRIEQRLGRPEAEQTLTAVSRAARAKGLVVVARLAEQARAGS